MLGVIPARGGSKRIPGKNLKVLNGKPLIAYTIEAAEKSQRLTSCIVSTECQGIAKVAIEYGACVVKRPEELATDEATSGSVCRHALDWMGHGYDMVCLLHPTSPIRDYRHIDQAIDMLWASDAPALASVSCRKRVYTHNASIYLMRRDWLLETGQHYCDESIPFLMDKRHSIDIDTPEDWALAELCLG